VNDHDVLITRYLEGSASADEVAVLNELLKKDADARALLRAASFQALTVADLGKSRAAAPAAGRQETPRWNSRPLAIAAALVLVAAVWMVSILKPERVQLTVVRTTGAVSWSARNGTFTTDLEPGSELDPGTMTLEGAKSGAELRFAGGSSVTLAGESEVSFGTDVSLRRGSITVEAGAPSLKLRTATAEAEGKNTCFTLSVQSGQTMVTVGAGRVRLRRLVDGASLDVLEGRMAVATLDATTPLESRAVPAPASGWSQTFDAAPPPIWQGEWVGADATGPGRLKNVLDVSYRRKDGTVVPAYVVSARNPAAITTIRSDSLLRVRWRMRTPSIGALLLISVQHPDGRFAGNFQVDLKPDDYPADGNGWRIYSAPVSALSGRFPEGARLPSIGRVSLVFMACYSPQGELEVAEVAFE
jgi:ferric-dicitrate binding protein FerR (iron transport regulator)